MEMREHARKIPLIETLDYIAKHITHTARPISLFQLPGDRTLSDYLKGGHVLKRSHSAGNQHVIVPKGNDGGSPRKQDGVSLDPTFDLKDEARWFLQEKVPFLEVFECRVGICLQRPKNEVIFRKWTGRSGDGWICVNVGALIDISKLQ